MSAPQLSMPSMLIWTFRIIDWSMIGYWTAISLGALAVITLPETLMYDGYGTPIIDAWNWSFAPLDILFAILGLAAVRLAQRGDQRWPILAISSLSLTFCAGLMAVAFWALRGEFNLSWWIPNLLLMVFALLWLIKIFRLQSKVEKEN